jgi:hypothetical protein
LREGSQSRTEVLGERKGSAPVPERVGWVDEGAVGYISAMPECSPCS